MKKIRLTNEAHVEGYEGAFYRFTTIDGKPSATGIWNNWYTATAVDDDGKEYSVVWEITNHEAFAAGDEDCCEWNSPAEVIDIETGLPVEAEIQW